MAERKNQMNQFESYLGEKRDDSSVCLVAVDGVALAMPPTCNGSVRAVGRMLAEEVPLSWDRSVEIDLIVERPRTQHIRFSGRWGRDLSPPELRDYAASLNFDDGSGYDYGFDEVPGIREPALDHGAALLLPIGAREYRGLEDVLAALQAAHDEGNLTENQQLQIMAMADSIRRARRETIPGKTERWKVVGVVGGALLYLFEKFPSGVVKWIELSEKLERMGWGNLAREIRELVENLPT